MAISATARAQADQALEDAATALKRNLGVTRKALQAVREAQVNVKGVEIQTQPPLEAESDASSYEATPRAD